MPAFWVVAVLGLQRLSKKAVKAANTLGVAVSGGLVKANNGAVLKTRWAWALWAYLVMLSSLVELLDQPNDAAARRPSES